MIDVERIDDVVWMQAWIIVFNLIHHEYVTRNLSLFRQPSLWHIKAISRAVEILHEGNEIQEELGGACILVEVFRLEFFEHADLCLELYQKGTFAKGVAKVLIENICSRLFCQL
jgi:hypothetical protein